MSNYGAERLVFNPGALRRARERLGFTQIGLAKESGIGQPVISRHENFNSSATPSQIDLVKYCRVLEITPKDLMSPQSVVDDEKNGVDVLAEDENEVGQPE